MTAMLAIALFAQVALTAGQAYTTADPINPERLGLATVDGRYMIELSDQGDCTAIVVGMNVMVWQVPTDDGSRVDTAIKPLNDDGTLADQDYCYVIVDQKMDRTPCFQTDGVCDVLNDPQPEQS